MYLGKRFFTWVQLSLFIVANDFLIILLTNQLDIADKSLASSYKINCDPS